MLKYCDIIKDNNPDLRVKCEKVDLPLSDEDLSHLLQMNEYLEKGYEENAEKKYDIRPGVGIAAPQIDVLKNMFVILAYDEKGVEYHFGVINPKILSYSEELTYLKTGEGCLSVDRVVQGYIHRPKRIKVEFDLFDFETNTTERVQARLKGYIAVVFQHEYDHLFGILFYDHINKKDPFYIPSNSSPIKFEGEEKEN